MKSITQIVVAAALAGVAAAPAVAGSSASASIGPFTVTLYDLNPVDALAPSITFHTDFGGQGSFASSSAIDPAAGSQSGSGWSLTAFGPASSSSAVGLASATGSVSGTLAGGISFAAAGAAQGSVVPGWATQFSASAASSNYYPGLSFDLSPFTLVVFSSTASLQATTTLGMDPSSYVSESANASVSLSISGPSPSGSGSQVSNDSHSLYASYVGMYDYNTGTFVYSGQSFSLDDVALSASFTNYTAALMTGNLNVSASVAGSTPMQPVPEPGTVAMLMAGLATVAFVARRRRG